MSRLGRWARARIRVVLPLAALAVAAFALTACGGSNAKDAAAAQSASNGANAAAPAAAASNGNQAASSGAAAAAAARIYIYADTVVGAKGMPTAEAPFRSCTEQSRFAPGEQLGWRIKVYDAASGDQLKDADVASVQVKLGDGQVFDAKYGSHGKPPTDSFWAYFWVIPNDYPTGLLPYTITATTTDGRTATFTNETINIDSSKLTIQAKS